MNRLPREIKQMVLQFEPVVGAWATASLATRGSVGYELFKWATFNTHAGLSALWRAIEDQATAAIPRWMVDEIERPTSEWLSVLTADVRAPWGATPSPPFMRLDNPQFLLAVMDVASVIDCVPPMVECGATRTLAAALTTAQPYETGAGAWALYYARRNKATAALKVLAEPQVLTFRENMIGNHLAAYRNVNIDCESISVLFRAIELYDEPFLCNLLLRTMSPAELMDKLVKLRRTKCLRHAMQAMGPGTLAALGEADVPRALRMFGRCLDVVVAAAKNPDPSVCRALLRSSDAWADVNVLVVAAAHANTAEWERLYAQTRLPRSSGRLARAVASAVDQRDFDALQRRYPALLSMEVLCGQTPEPGDHPQCPTQRQHHLAHGALFDRYSLVSVRTAFCVRFPRPQAGLPQRRRRGSRRPRGLERAGARRVRETSGAKRDLHARLGAAGGGGREPRGRRCDGRDTAPAAPRNGSGAARSRAAQRAPRRAEVGVAQLRRPSPVGGGTTGTSLHAPFCAELACECFVNFPCFEKAKTQTASSSSSSQESASRALSAAAEVSSRYRRRMCTQRV